MTKKIIAISCRPINDRAKLKEFRQKVKALRPEDQAIHFQVSAKRTEERNCANASIFGPGDYKLIGQSSFLEVVVYYAVVDGVLPKRKIAEIRDGARLTWWLLTEHDQNSEEIVLVQRGEELSSTYSMKVFRNKVAQMQTGDKAVVRKGCSTNRSTIQRRAHLSLFENGDYRSRGQAAYIDVLVHFAIVDGNVQKIAELTDGDKKIYWPLVNNVRVKKKELVPIAGKPGEFLSIDVRNENEDTEQEEALRTELDIKGKNTFNSGRTDRAIAQAGDDRQFRGKHPQIIPDHGQTHQGPSGGKEAKLAQQKIKLRLNVIGSVYYAFNSFFREVDELEGACSKGGKAWKIGQPADLDARIKKIQAMLEKLQARPKKKELEDKVTQLEALIGNLLQANGPGRQLEIGKEIGLLLSEIYYRMKADNYYQELARILTEKKDEAEKLKNEKEKFTVRSWLTADGLICLKLIEKFLVQREIGAEKELRQRLSALRYSGISNFPEHLL
ncbi:MAG: hypothetical protein WC838_06900 [Candidatus Margulisiibacteriota bacterium]